MLKIKCCVCKEIFEVPDVEAPEEAPTHCEECPPPLD